MESKHEIREKNEGKGKKRWWERRMKRSKVRKNKKKGR